MKLSQTGTLLMFLVILTVGGSGCNTINRVRAKNELNEAARAYREQHFSDAEMHSKRALDFDPNNRTAEAFIARTMHAQFKPGVDTEDNRAKARAAVDAYQKLLKLNPKSEEAYKAIAALLGPLHEDVNHTPDPKGSEGAGQRAWVQARANDSSVAAPLRAEAYTVLASKDWDCSFKITESPANKQTQTKDNRAIVVYKKPQAQKDYDDARMCMTKGLEEATKAIELDPNSESAWSYKTNLLLEGTKLAEMDGKNDQKEQYQKQAEAAQKQTTVLNEQNQQKKKEEEAKKSASPPAT